MYRLKITLQDVTPDVWRLIEVPDDYTFWDLHVAIQDAMGWLDYHLHAFAPASDQGDSFRAIGIPEDDRDEMFQAGWEVPISQYLRKPGDRMRYEYDFGDDWVHEVRLVSLDSGASGGALPRCIDGKGACPPEDCGGPGGYRELLNILDDPGHEEHSDIAEWLKSQKPGQQPFRPEVFDESAVAFSDPRTRLRLLFEDRN